MKIALRPVKVTAHLVSPLALSPDGQAPFLDSLCEFVMSSRMRTIHECSGGRHRMDFARRRGQEVETPGQIPIPIARKFVDGLPIPLCSSGIYSEMPQRIEHYSRRFPTEMASLLSPDDRGVLQATGGPFKSFRLPLRLVDAERVVWFAMLRKNPSRLRMLLSKHIGCIGKKTSQGFGAVWRWEVEPIECDWSWFADGVLMRPLPASEASSAQRGFRRTFCGVCPPYWQRSLWREAVTPC